MTTSKDLDREKLERGILPTVGSPANVMRVLVRSIQFALALLILASTMVVCLIVGWGMGHFGSVTPTLTQNIQFNQHGLITYYNQTEYFLLRDLPDIVCAFAVIAALAAGALEGLLNRLGMVRDTPPDSASS